MGKVATFQSHEGVVKGFIRRVMEPASQKTQIAVAEFIGVAENMVSRLIEIKPITVKWGMRSIRYHRLTDSSTMAISSSVRR